MEHSLVCSVETGGEGLWLFKATNKLVGEAPPTFDRGAFWESGSPSWQTRSLVY